MKYHVINMAFAILLAISAGSCSKSETDGEDIPFSPIELTGQTRSIVSGGNSFGYKLLKEAAEQEEGSFTFSPLSLTFTLALMCESATEGEYFEQKVAEIMGFEGGTTEDIRHYCSTMARQLPGLSEKVQFTTANAVVLDSDHEESKAVFKDIAETYYNTMVESMSFKDDRSAIVKLVNEWAATNTKGQIKGLIRPGDVIPGVDIIANALYFKGQWKYSFDKRNTTRQTFTGEDGKESKVDMMSMDPEQSSGIPYCENDIFQAVSLPYGNGAFVLTVYLPKPGHDIVDAAGYLAGEGTPTVSGGKVTELSLPRFSIKESNVGLLKYISESVGEDPSNPGGRIMDFGRDIHQVSSIEVDESGTEAAAATIMHFMSATAPKSFCADHPFIFTISESSTGAVLLAGAFRGNE